MRTIAITAAAVLAAITITPMAAAQPTTAAPAEATAGPPPGPPPDGIIITPTRTPSSGGQVATLAPFIPITEEPATSSPLVTPPTPAPVTARPTERPTMAPMPRLPTNFPTISPSFRPSTTKAPSWSPSFSPTDAPTFTHRPTGSPSKSSQPTWSPSTSHPTISPTPMPTISPVEQPSSAPSNEETLSITRECQQTLEIETLEKFDTTQVNIYQLIMQSYTKEFGHMVGTPQIVTTCRVVEQELAGRRLQDAVPAPVPPPAPAPTGHLLIMTFTMQYESRYGYNVDDYPKLFQNYINTNLEQVAKDMRLRFLPVVAAREVIVYNTDEPTTPPTKSPLTSSATQPPTGSPTLPMTPSPTRSPSLEPTRTKVPTIAPTMSPVTMTPTSSAIVEDRTAFIAGLSAGLGGAAIVVMLLIWYMRRKGTEKEDERAAAGGDEGGYDSRPSNDNPHRVEEGIVIRQVDANPGGEMVPGAGRRSSHGSRDHLDHGPENASSPQGDQTIDSIFSNPSLVSHGESLDSDENHHSNHDASLPLDTLQDEFDDYKNQDLEYMREGVEESVYGAEGMMSLAMTRALMEDEDDEAGLTRWGGAEDPESIEANGLCETNDWLRKHDRSTLDERNLFFQEILNKMVVTVRRGMISPSDGTRAVHCCAAMLGLRLERDLPNNVLLVHGMRKTADLSLGRNYLVETFRAFGDIEGAAIAPNNRGFGFVRFVSPRSVQRALEKFRIAEIEVQDVSVMIKSLKSDAQAM